jgi:hypothetical protein
MRLSRANRGHRLNVTLSAMAGGETLKARYAARIG